MNKIQFETIMSNIEYKIVQNESLYNEIEKIVGDAGVQKAIDNSFLKELVDFATAALQDSEGLIEDIVFEKSGVMPYEHKILENTLVFENWGDLYDYLTE